jgi:hypothetical protein
MHPEALLRAFSKKQGRNFYLKFRPKQRFGVQKIPGEP